ncbi:cytochrome c oxidase subunit 4 [Streptomyces sp. NPDC003077]|uniref:aa3-type cytochrome oxidase subunit IV n=1 Tax=Streptomyces sp. NPDC003077 TaxID=3154443 RepID=UPI0033A4C749
MKVEAYLFAGVAFFFLVTDVLYAVGSREPAGIAALTMSFVMLTLIGFYFGVMYRRKGRRPEDRKGAEIRERVGRLDFFPPHSVYPVLTATGSAVFAVGVVYGLWLALIGLGVLLGGAFGLVFQFAGRED